MMTPSYSIQASSIARTYLYMCGKQVVCAVGKEDRNVEKGAYVRKMCKSSHFRYEFCANLYVFRTFKVVRGQIITRKRAKIRIINEKHQH